MDEHLFVVISANDRLVPGDYSISIFIVCVFFFFFVNFNMSCFTVFFFLFDTRRNSSSYAVGHSKPNALFTSIMLFKIKILKIQTTRLAIL